MTKIMLVEDDNNLREIYEARLLAEGYEIISAKDGEEALSLAMKEKPDLIISDVMMPKISGFDMLDLLRSTPETRDTKVIMMTALSQAEDKNRADKLGADRYLVKSQVTLEDVAKVAKEVLDGQSDQTATTAGTAVIDPTAPVADTSAATPADAAPVDTSTPPATDATSAAAPVTDQSDQTAPSDAPAVSPAVPTTTEDPASTSPAAPGADTPVTDSAAPTEPAEPTAPAPEAGDAPVAEAAPTPATPAEPAPASNEPAPTLPTTDVDQNLAAPAEAENEQIKSQIDQFVATVPSNEPPAPEVPAIKSSAPAPNAEAAADTLEPQTNSESPATGLTTLEPTTTIPVKEAPPIIEAPDNSSGNGSTQKKIIQPINDLSKNETNLNELLEKEQQKEAAAAGVATATPPATSVVEPGGATVTPPHADQIADQNAPGATVAPAPAPAPSGDDPANVAL